MHASQSILLTAVEQVRRPLEVAETDKYTDDYLVRYLIQSAFAFCVTELGMGDSAPIICKMALSLVVGTDIYQLPPNIESVVRLVKFDDGGRLMSDWRPDTNLNHPFGPGWRLNGNIIQFDPPITNDQEWELWYMPSGDCCVHYATDGMVAAPSTTTALVIAGGTWTASTKTLTKTGAFANLTLTPGLCIYVSGGTGATVGWYPIATRVSDNAVTLYTSIGANNVDTATTLTGNADTVTLSTTPAVGLRDRRINAYVGHYVRLLQSGKTIEERIISSYDAETGNAVVHIPFTGTSLPSPLGAVTYEIMFPGHRSLMEMMSAYAARELGEDRGVPPGKLQSLDMKYRRVKKLAFDRTGVVQSRTGKHFERYTVDNVDVGPDMWRMGRT